MDECLKLLKCPQKRLLGALYWKPLDVVVKNCAAKNLKKGS
jgi:hypothetical protein